MKNSLQVNPPTATLHIDVKVTDWLWAVLAFLVVSTFFAVLWAHTQPRGTRTFHYIAVVVLTTASIAYFAMASDLGQTAVVAEFPRGAGAGVTRSVFWVRYIQWFINAPLLLLMLMLATGLPLSDIFLSIFMIEVVVITGLVGALTPTSYKWGFFTMGACAMLFVVFKLIHAGRTSRFHAHRNGYTRGAGYLAFFFLLYPLAWALCEGSNVIHPTGEMVFYSVLDIFAGPVFIFTHLTLFRSVEYGALGLTSGKTSDYAGAGMATRGDMEKGPNPGPA